jgi:hypothetical protein
MRSRLEEGVGLGMEGLPANQAIYATTKIGSRKHERD